MIRIPITQTIIDDMNVCASEFGYIARDYVRMTGENKMKKYVVSEIIITNTENGRVARMLAGDNAQDMDITIAEQIVAGDGIKVVFEWAVVLDARNIKNLLSMM